MFYAGCFYGKPKKYRRSTVVYLTLTDTQTDTPTDTQKDTQTCARGRKHTIYSFIYLFL